MWTYRTPAPVRSLAECLTCRVIFKELISRLEANTTMNIVIRELDLICDTVLPTKDQEKCRNFTTKMIQTGEAILPFILKVSQRTIRDVSPSHRCVERRLQPSHSLHVSIQSIHLRSYYFQDAQLLSRAMLLPDPPRAGSSYTSHVHMDES